MKTIEIKLYKFDELSEQGKQLAIEKYRKEGIDTDYIYSEAQQTVDAFCELFNIKTSLKSWLNFGECLENDDVLNMNGERLRRWVSNNYFAAIYKGKYLGSIKKRQHLQHKNLKSNVLNNGNLFQSYYSSIIKDKACVLTGVYYDDVILQPIYDFIEKGDFIEGLETLFDVCFEKLNAAIDDEVEHLHSNETLIKNIQANNYDFTENGEIY